MSDPILEAAKLFIGWGHAETDAEVRFPRAGPSLPKSRIIEQGEERLTNCSSMTTAILAYAYPMVPWDADTYAKLQVFKADSPLSPIEAVIGVELEAHLEPATRFTPDHWHLFVAVGRHEFLGFSADGVTVTVLESQPSRGPAWRGGPRLSLEQLVAPPDQHPNYTLRDLESAYPDGVFYTTLKTPEEYMAIDKELTPSELRKRGDEPVNRVMRTEARHRPSPVATVLEEHALHPGPVQVSPLLVLRLLAKLGPVAVQFAEALKKTSDGGKKITAAEWKAMGDVLARKGVEVLKEEAGL